jgi:acetyltransferase-like isoleucine patch superfamily enzyme
MSGPALRRVEPSRPGPLRRTGIRLAAQLVYLGSGSLGDDWLGRRLRIALLRLFGARLAPGASFHGGSYFTVPGNLIVGAGSFINRNCYFDLEGRLTLGENVTVGHGTTFVTTEHEVGGSAHRCGPSIPRSISVGDGAWLGANCTVLPGVRIGPGAVVAAGAVVRSDVPADWLVAGVPARLIRDLNEGTELSRPTTIHDGSAEASA